MVARLPQPRPRLPRGHGAGFPARALRKSNGAILSSVPGRAVGPPCQWHPGKRPGQGTPRQRPGHRFTQDRWRLSGVLARAQRVRGLGRRPSAEGFPPAVVGVRRRVSITCQTRSSTPSQLCSTNSFAPADRAHQGGRHGPHHLQNGARLPRPAPDFRCPGRADFRRHRLRLLRAIVAIGMALDPVFFPRLARARANRPIVLVGNPRTGTTFLQRFLADEGFGSRHGALHDALSLPHHSEALPTFPTAPGKISPAKFHATRRTTPTSPRSKPTTWRCSSATSMASSCTDSSCRSTTKNALPWFDPRVRDTSARDFAWLDALWRRSLVLHTQADRNIAKLFSLSVRLPRSGLLSRGPDPLHGTRPAVDHSELHEPGRRRARPCLRVLVLARGGTQALARTYVPGVDRPSRGDFTRNGRAAPSTNVACSSSATTA